jgi:nucleolar protein 6
MKRKIKKDKKDKKEKKEKHEKKAKNETDDGEKSAPVRFICFVGNLPYDATLDQINAHFSKIAPSSVRHATEKATGKSKGYAFLEFDHYDKMKTCLKLYHHSIFDPEARGKGKDAADAQEDDKERTKAGGKQKKGRRLNVELTAGGGGKSKARRAKISSKNQKLEEERGRRRLKEKAEREKSSQKQKAPPETGANAVEVKDTRGAVHPSRLSRVSH